MEEVGQLFGAHAQFIEWRRLKASVLATVEHLFPPKHPLRAAVCNALCGDPLAYCTLQADDASCRLCDRIGDEKFRKRSGGLACTQLFYGPSARADDRVDLPLQPVRSQWLRLNDLERIMDLGHHARGFAGSVRALTRLPRKRALIDSCEVRFLSSWELALEALVSVEVDMRGAFFMGAALRRAGLPPDVCRAILEFATQWPQLAGDGKAWKRRRVVR